MSPLAVAALLTVCLAAVVVLGTLRRTGARDRPAPADEPVPAVRPFAMDLRVACEVSRLVGPDSEVGPTAVEIPCTGFYLLLAITTESAAEPVEFTIAAEVTGERPLGGDAVSHGTRLSLPPPHFEIRLDERPPTVRPTVDDDNVRIYPRIDSPFTVPPGTSIDIVMTPLTRNRGIVEWDLHLGATAGDGHWQLTAPVRTTGDHRWRTFFPGGDRPGGRPPAETPIETFSMHWPNRTEPGTAEEPPEGGS